MEVVLAAAIWLPYAVAVVILAFVAFWTGFERGWRDLWARVLFSTVVASALAPAGCSALYGESSRSLAVSFGAPWLALFALTLLVLGLRARRWATAATRAPTHGRSRRRSLRLLPRRGPRPRLRR